MMEQRQKVIDEALTWQGTKYHPCARIKGAGADCLTFIAGVFENAGLIPRIEIPHYPPDWHLHQDGEKYLEGLLKYCKEISEPRPGGIALWKFGRCFSHGAIIIEWPRIVHSYIKAGVVLENAHEAQWLLYTGEKRGQHAQKRQIRFFDFWEGK